MNMLSNASNCVISQSPKKSNGSSAANQCITGRNNPSQELALGYTSEDSEECSGAEVSSGKACAGKYDPSQFAYWNVSKEVKELFVYISRYKVRTVEIDSKLKPFIPKYIPAVGKVDGFIRIPRPDGKAEGTGLIHLTEPCLRQSDPSVLELGMRSSSRHANMQPLDVRSLQNAEKCPKEVANWIDRISELHRARPSPVVQCSKLMPRIESLMQVWHPGFESAILNPKSHGVFSFSKLDITLGRFVHLLLTLLDIPWYTNLLDSLHLLWTLYIEFRENQHFKAGSGI